MTEAASAAFLVEHDDAAAGIRKQFILSYWEKDHSVAMYNPHEKRWFLKRAVPPEKVTLDNFSFGGTVVICSRLLKVLDYADEATRKKFAAVRGSACLLVKPDGYHYLGKIMTMVYNAELLIGRARMVKFSADEAHAFLSVGGGAAAKPEAVTQLTADYCVALEVTGDDVVSRLHELAGPADPDVAREVASYSIRAVMGTDKVNNAVFVSGTGEAAGKELEFVFDRRYSYTGVFTHCAACIIKPHAVKAKAAGHIIDTILAAGLEVSALRTVVLTRDDASDYLEAYRGVYPEYERWVAEMASGTALVLEVRGDDAVDSLRDLVGPFDPEIGRALRPTTLRAVHGIDSVKNAVHVTDMPQDGPLETKFFFRVLE